jgi:hypothetical protein
MTPSDTASSIKVEVTPKDAKVYVDGYFAGMVDDFDGTFQRLRVSPGKHDVVLFQEGYHLLKQTMYLSPNNTYKIKGELTKLAPGDAPEQAPTPPPMPPPSAQARLLPDPFGEPPQQGAPPPPQGQLPQAPPDQRAIEVRGPSTDSRFGRLAIRVQPQGAEVYIDGERWLAPDTGRSPGRERGRRPSPHRSAQDGLRQLLDPKWTCAAARRRRSTCHFRREANERSDDEDEHHPAWRGPRRWRCRERSRAGADVYPIRRAVQGPLIVERIPSGWVVSPDVTITEVNKQAATLVGAYGGWLSDRTWLVGRRRLLARQQHPRLQHGVWRAS